jgi:replicative DNA helicase
MNRHESWNPAAPVGTKSLDDVGLEQAILGALLLSEYGHAMQHLVERIAVEDFSRNEHRAIFHAIQSLVAKGQAPTFALLKPLLLSSEASQEVLAYLGRLVSVSAPPALAPAYIKALKEKSARRQLMDLAGFAIAIAQSPITDVVEGAAEIVDRIDTVCSTIRERKSTLTALEHAAPAVIATLGRQHEGIGTGLLDFDRVLGGWHRRELSILAGRPSMGKSALLFSSFMFAARKGTSSLIFSLEMPTDAVVKRMLSDAVWNRDTPIPYVKAMRGELTAHEIGRLVAVSEKMAKLPLAIDDQAGLTVSEIRARAKRHIDRLDAAGERLDVVVIDHLGKVRASDRYAGNKVHEMGEKSAAFAEMAKDLNVAVVCAHQLNRAVEGRDNKRPTLADLRDSGNIEEDAETVMFLYRPAYYLERTREDQLDKEDARKDRLSECENDLEVIVAKNRNGPCCTIELYVDMASNVIRDRAVG